MASPYNSDGVSRIDVTGPDLVVSRDAGPTIALCLHELITNAIKYGALSLPDGHVELLRCVAAGGNSELSLNWTVGGGGYARTHAAGLWHALCALRAGIVIWCSS